MQDLSVKMSASGSCRTSCARSLYEIRNRNFTSISRDGHARSPQRVALRNPKSQFHLHSAHSTRTISAEGCTSKSKKRNFTCIPRTRHARPQRVALRNQKNGISPAFRALDTHDLAEGSHFETMLQKYCACHEIMSRGHTKCCTGHANASSSSSSQMQPLSGIEPFDLKI